MILIVDSVLFSVSPYLKINFVAGQGKDNTDIRRMIDLGFVDEMAISPRNFDSP